MSILATFFCCMPFGIVAIVNSVAVDSQWSAGDHAGAHRSAEAARKWINYSAITGLVAIGGYILFYVFIVLLAIGSA